MNTLDRLLHYLMRMNCLYEHDRHALAYTAREVAHAEHIPERTFAKTVVVHSETGYAMAVAPANMKVDLEELREAFGFHRLRLATESELQGLFPDCELGAMPPFGNDTLFEMPVYADSRMLKEPEIAFNAGTHRDVVRMKTQEWQALVKPSIVELARSVGA
jgi:Ala-tRNA(Pro) deacylase